MHKITSQQILEAKLAISGLLLKLLTFKKELDMADLLMDEKGNASDVLLVVHKLGKDLINDVTKSSDGIQLLSNVIDDLQKVKRNYDEYWSSTDDEWK